jgi:hypothetical protein
MIGSSAILPSLVVGDPFHKTLNAAIVDFFNHGEGELRANCAFVCVCVGPTPVSLRIVVASSRHSGSLLETENGIRRTDISPLCVTCASLLELAAAY